MENNTQIALPETFKPEVFKKLIDQAPDIYTSAQNVVSKALTIGKKLINEAKQEKTANGRISENLDERLKNYLINAKNAKKNINDKRSPVTKIFQDVTKLYTSLENNVDVTKSGTYAAQIQELRNELATLKAEEQRQQELKLQREKKITEEKITVRSTVEQFIKEKYFEYLGSVREKIFSLFNSLTLENWNTKVEELKNYDNKYPENHYLTIKPVVSKIYITDDDVALIVEEYRDIKMYTEFSGDFKKKIEALKADLIEKLPSKKKELEAIKQAEFEALGEIAEILDIDKTYLPKLKVGVVKQMSDKLIDLSMAYGSTSIDVSIPFDVLSISKDEFLNRFINGEKVKDLNLLKCVKSKATILKERVEARESEEAEKLKQEEEAEKEKAVSEAKANEDVSKANTLFEMEAQNAEVAVQNNVNKSFKIEIINPAGYLPIISFYFQKEGNGKPVDVLSKKTLGSMVTFAEKYYDKHDEKVNSPHVIYKEVVKAVNK